MAEAKTQLTEEARYTSCLFDMHVSQKTEAVLKRVGYPIGLVYDKNTPLYFVPHRNLINSGIFPFGKHLLFPYGVVLDNRGRICD